MAQATDYELANQSGASFRSELNTILAAIASANSGATEPTTMYPYMLWADTSSGFLKQRNAANNAWISILKLSSGEVSALLSPNLSGNLTFTGTGNRITGDFSNATETNRVALQSSTTNGDTIVPLYPNGSGSLAGFSTPTVPMVFNTNGAERMRIDTSGNITQSTSANAVISNAIINVNAGSSAAAQFSTISNGGTLQFSRYSVAAGNVATIFNSGGGLFIGTADANILNIRTNGTDHLKVDSTGNILKISATGGLGYGTGAGGTVTQATSKSTTVVLNKPCGQITMNNAALAAGTAVTFTLTNSVISGSDVIAISTKSSISSNGVYIVSVDAVGTGECFISLRNVGAISRSDAVVLNFTVIKGATS